MEQRVVIGSLPTPLGTLGAVVTDRGLARLSFATEGEDACALWVRRRLPSARLVEDDGRLAAVAEQLAAYAGGTLRAFSLPLDLQGTPFQLAVWQALLAIEYGRVQTYAQVAASIGRPRAVRAVGAANGANPIPIVVPCHRLVGADGRLTGYGGGLALKDRLLRLEGYHRA